MNRSKQRLACALVGVLVSISLARADEKEESAAAAMFGEFVGSSPCGESIRALLQIPADANAELMEWKLTLYQDPKTRAPARYTLRCDYGLTVAGTPGLGKTTATVERQGRWTIAKGTKSKSDAVVYELEDAVSLVKIDDGILHVLDRDRRLMIGTGGWSYTLNRADSAEKPADPKLAETGPEMSYTISPVATGPTTVFGVFEGRSPCLGIARDLKIAVHPACSKAKWRVTLYHDPKSLAPTTYKVEGTLFRQAAREGDWSITRGTPAGPHAVVYRLSPVGSEAALFLLQGDDNVLFFLDHDHNPLVGHAEFSYTLNRRSSSP